MPRFTHTLISTALLILASLAAGCSQENNALRGPLPAPLSLDAQVRALNSRARLIPYLRASTVPLGVQLRYQNADGKQQSQNAEGSLLIKQRFWDDPRPADAPAKSPGTSVLLIGKAFEQQQFQAGKNDANWWFIVFADTKVAWTGSLKGENPTVSLGDAGVLRADLVPDLLAITEIAPGLTETVSMRVNDERGTNDILIQNFRPDRTSWVKREIIVDRRTGDVSEVTLYNPAGMRLVRAVLTDYVAAPRLAEGGDATISPRLPRKVKIDYFAEKMTIKLEFQKIEIPTSAREDAFDTPDFEDLHVRVIHVDQ